MKIITEIQSKLKAPKGQTNAFGKYKYRSCEDIVEAVKPLLAELDCFLNISDEMVMLGDRFYVKATAMIQNSDGASYSASGYLKIDDEYMKKLQTDALTKGLSFLGFNSDVFEGLFDDNRYVAEMNKQFAEQIAPEPIRQDSVDWAVNQYKEIIMADTEEVDFLKMQAIDRRLSNDEKIAVNKGLGDETYSPNSSSKGRLFRTLVADYLKMKPEDLLNKDDFFDANLLDGDK